MSTEVAINEIKEIIITKEEADLIKHTICQEATDAEMRLFFYDCQRRGVHPLDKLIHFTKRGKMGQKKYVPITSIDLFRIRAHGSGAFDGEDEPIYEIGADGFPDTCKYVVYRRVQGQQRPWHATARWSEYYPGDELGFVWKKMPFLMLAKCAEALALRKAFPAELQGLYVKEEMDQAGPPMPEWKPATIERSSMPADEAGLTTPDGLLGRLTPSITIPQPAREAPAPSHAEADAAIAQRDLEQEYRARLAVTFGAGANAIQRELVADARLTHEAKDRLYQDYAKALKAKAVR